jgi:hypothetical protein
MERLTSDKKVSDMSMIELAHNSCYADDKRNARYRDYDLDIDSRQLVRNLMKDMCGEDLSDLSDEEFDEYMGSMLSIELDSEVGLLALFYRNLWAMANLRETLKKYEDLEEQGRLIKLPCKVGDAVFYISGKIILEYEVVGFSVDGTGAWLIYGEHHVDENDKTYGYNLDVDKIGKTVFLTREEAKSRLKELRGGENDSMEP